MDNTKLLFTFTKNILNSDRAIRWVGITDQNGNIINEWDREGLKSFLTIEENHQWAIRTITRQQFVISVFFIVTSASAIIVTIVIFSLISI